MAMKYATSALVGIVIVATAFAVGQGDTMGKAVAALMSIIGMSMLIVSIVFGWKSPVSTSEVGDREDT